VAEEFVEGEVRLEPGDTLLVGSDGLMELGDTARLEEAVAGLDVGDHAAAVVGRLVGRVQARRSDDVTIVVLRRLAAVQVTSLLPLGEGRGGGRQ
jgi:serine phosphatase RsbU (regulator of sigma subunit)